ncbi:MAG: hypothetical protein K0S41_707 [Anaerocolumna sp.]|jgi:hypothetical protein|nr:hypothetical protein [Anaerocolumna sp.]
MFFCLLNSKEKSEKLYDTNNNDIIAKEQQEEDLIETIST